MRRKEEDNKEDEADSSFLYFVSELDISSATLLSVMCTKTIVL
jgi:hypothetical protein